VRADELSVEADYMLITGDDCFYPRSCVEYLLFEMEKGQKLVVSSGNIMEASPSRKYFAPHGSSRIVRGSLFRKIGNRYPPRYGTSRGFSSSARATTKIIRAPFFLG